MRQSRLVAELEQLLVDDVPYGDLTTEALGIGARQPRWSSRRATR